MEFFFLGAFIFFLLFTEPGRQVLPSVLAGMGCWFLCISVGIYMLYTAVVQPILKILFQ